MPSKNQSRGQIWQISDTGLNQCPMFVPISPNMVDGKCLTFVWKQSLLWQFCWLVVHTLHTFRFQVFALNPVLSIPLSFRGFLTHFLRFKIFQGSKICQGSVFSSLCGKTKPEAKVKLKLLKMLNLRKMFCI